MKKNIEELTRKLNEFRMNSMKKTFTRSELVESLHSLGFNKVIIGYLIPNFSYEKLGTAKLFTAPKEPIHKSIVASAYQKQSKQRKDCYKKSKQKTDNLGEEEALKLLSSKGYQIRKCVGFDLERFSQENPVLYKKYLKYEVL